MITVKLHENDALNMLLDRLEYWTDKESVIALYRKMYANAIDCGVFDSCELDAMLMVDNDWVNNCDIVEKGEKDFDKLLKLYNDGEYDVSCEEFQEYSPSFIEAVSDDETMILIRY